MRCDAKTSRLRPTVWLFALLAPVCELSVLPTEIRLPSSREIRASLLMYCTGARSKLIRISAASGTSTAYTAATELFAMSARCSRLAAVCAAVTIMLTGSPSARAGDPTRATSPPPSPQDCRPVYIGTATTQGQLVDLRSQAGIDCPRDGNTAPYGAAGVILQ